MTDKERMENIKDKQLQMHALSTFDVSWLIEQAERVQELEESNKRNYWIGTEFKFENLNLEQQNERYREALEFYADKNNYKDSVIAEWGPMMPVLRDEGHKARKTLEDSK